MTVESRLSLVHGISIFVPSSDWPATKCIITSSLARFQDLSIWVRGGAVLPIGSEISEIEFGPHEQGEGRRLKRYSQTTNSAKQLKLFEAALSTATAKPSKPTAREIILGQNDCISIAPVSQSWVDSILDQLESQKLDFQVAIQWDTRNILHKRFFWDILISINLVVDGIIFDQFEDGPTEFLTKDGSLRFVPEETYGKPPDRNWFFTGSKTEVIFEYDAPAARIPQELESETISSRVTNLIQKTSSAERIASALVSSRTKRISPMDASESNATTNTARPGNRFPELRMVEEKLLDYSLSEAHNKRPGFLRHGLGFSPERDAHKLAGDICSSLLQDFPVIDARANADGTAQFTAPFAMIAPFGDVLRLNTSWVISETQAPYLATAFVVSEDAYPEWTSPPPIPIDPLESLRDRILTAFERAIEFSDGFISDYLPAKWTVLDRNRTGTIVAILQESLLSHDHPRDLPLAINSICRNKCEVFGDPSFVEALLRYAQYELARQSIQLDLEWEF